MTARVTQAERNRLLERTAEALASIAPDLHNSKLPGPALKIMNAAAKTGYALSAPKTWGKVGVSLAAAQGTLSSIGELGLITKHWRHSWATDFLHHIRTIHSAMHGEPLTITLDDDPEGLLGAVEVLLDDEPSAAPMPTPPKKNDPLVDRGPEWGEW